MSLTYEVKYTLSDAIIPREVLPCIPRMEHLRHDVEHRLDGPAELWTDSELVWYEYGHETYRVIWD